MANFQWIDGDATANDCLRVWTNGSEWQWAQEAWKHLEDAGLAQCDTPKQYVLSAARFMALCRFYLDWASFHDGPHEGTIYWCGQDGPLQPFYLGQLLADEEVDDLDERGFSSGEALEFNALKLLIERERGNIVPVLLNAFGGDMELHQALARTLRPPVEERPNGSSSLPIAILEENEAGQFALTFDDQEEQWEDEEDFDDSEANADSMQAFEWIQSGCPVRF